MVATIAELGEDVLWRRRRIRRDLLICSAESQARIVRTLSLKRLSNWIDLAESGIDGKAFLKG
jgi:hypothetical protein